jgi:tetratricopeptide (TPR) repeat protein
MATVNPTTPAPSDAPEPVGYAPAPSDDFATRASDFYYERRGLVIGVIAALAVLALVVVGYIYFQQNQAAEAEAALVQPALTYGEGRFEEALPGLLEVSDEYDGTPAGNLAAFYAGDALFRQGRYDEALAQFEEVNRSDDLLGHNAAAGLAATHEQLGNYGEAAEHYEEALERYENPAMAPGLLLAAARSYHAAGDYASARAAIETLTDEYPDAREAGEAELLLGRIDASEAVSG